MERNKCPADCPYQTALPKIMETLVVLKADQDHQCKILEKVERFIEGGEAGGGARVQLVGALEFIAAMKKIGWVIVTTFVMQFIIGFCIAAVWVVKMMGKMP